MPDNETKSESTLERFRSFLKALLSVSKKELDAAIAAEKCAPKTSDEPEAE